MNHIYIYHSNPDRFPSAYIHLFYECLTDTEKNRCSKFKFENDKKNFIISHSLIRYGLMNKLCSFYYKIESKENEAIKLRRNKVGSINLSLSHTNKLAVCAISKTNRIGIDAESIESKDYTEVYSFSLNHNEINQLEDNGDPSKAFLTFWTKKEAFLKGKGIGLRIDPKDIQCDLYTGLIVDKKEQFKDVNNWHVDTINISPYHICSLAYNVKPREELEIKIKQISPFELHTFFKMYYLCLS